MSGSTETAGYCPADAIIYRWTGALPLRRACCPRCGLPLVKRPRASSLGKHDVSTERPITRERRPLVMRVLED